MDDEEEGQPIHHCALISEVSQLLPAIEYLDISTPAICECALHGHFNPSKPTGTFKLTIVSEAWSPCSPQSVHFHAAGWGAKPLLQLMKAAQLHFAEAGGWDVQLRLGVPGTPSRKSTYVSNCLLVQRRLMRFYRTSTQRDAHAPSPREQPRLLFLKSPVHRCTLTQTKSRQEGP